MIFFSFSLHANLKTVTEAQLHKKSSKIIHSFFFIITLFKFYLIMIFFHIPFIDPHANFQTVTETQLHHKS